MKVITKSNRKSTEYAQIALLCFYAVVVGVYFALRFAGNWMEVDTARLTQAARAVFNEGTITSSYPYGHGFNYPVVVAAIAQVSGLSVTQLQTLILPMIGILAPVLVAFAFFRAVLGKENSAFLAVLLLSVQSDFLFVTLRGSHEKLTWSLTMLALLILYRSAAKRESFYQLTIHTILFYVIVFAQITTNQFFASTFMTAIILSFLIGIVLNRWQNQADNKTSHHFLTRLAMISISSLLLFYFFLFHLYSPAQQIFHLLPQIGDKIGAFLFGFYPQTNPYAYIGLSWINPAIYFSVSIFTWLILAISLAEWVRQGYYLLRGKETLRLPQSLPWLLYAGFAIEVALAIVMDFAGVLSGNLQIRILPALILFAVVLTTQALQHALRSINWTPARRLTLSGAVMLLFLWFVLSSLLKITNDPLVTNKWLFFNESEKIGFQWSHAHTQAQNRYMWVGSDERLLMMFFADHLVSESLYDFGLGKANTPYVLLSETEKLRHARVGAFLPEVNKKNNIYDNGHTELYHRVPKTPYQK